MNIGITLWTIPFRQGIKGKWVEEHYQVSEIRTLNSGFPRAGKGSHSDPRLELTNS
jgi:phage-related protein